MTEVTPIFPDMFEFWEARIVEADRLKELSERNLARLALTDQLQFTYEEDLPSVPQIPFEVREV